MVMQACASTRTTAHMKARTPAGVEHPSNSSDKHAVSEPGGAKSDANDGSTPGSLLPADLAAVIYAWPTLPPAMRAGILAMVHAAKGGV
jgi:hypothetical protein